MIVLAEQRHGELKSRVSKLLEEKTDDSSSSSAAQVFCGGAACVCRQVDMGEGADLGWSCLACFLACWILS